jgi:hypothetical protein
MSKPPILHNKPGVYSNGKDDTVLVVYPDPDAPNGYSYQLIPPACWRVIDGSLQEEEDRAIRAAQEAEARKIAAECEEEARAFANDDVPA